MPPPTVVVNSDLEIPFPTERLANIAHKSISVDKELSPLVRRSFSVRNQPQNASHAAATILHVQYKATTNRMLRVAVNTFMESLSLVIEVMEHLDADVLQQSQQQGNKAGEGVAA